MYLKNPKLYILKQYIKNLEIKKKVIRILKLEKKTKNHT